jgi:5-hydroxyisourate hydrolase
VSISTHVLDTMRGVPATGLGVTLSRRDARGGWVPLGGAATDADGRVRSLAEGELDPGVYRVEFATGPYFEGLGSSAFYPEVSVVFKLEAAGGHLHIPLLLSRFGYTTYRGT